RTARGRSGERMTTVGRLCSRSFTPSPRSPSRDQRPIAGYLRTRAAAASAARKSGKLPRLEDPMNQRAALAISLAVSVLAASPSTPSAQTAGERIGHVSFPTSCAAAVQKPFERAVARLHSFWYIEAAGAFPAVTQADPACAIGYWGLAMSQWTQIWAPPQPAALKRGLEAVEKAKAASAKTARERDYIAAAEAFFKDADTLDHRTRTQAYGRAMEQLYAKYPNDREAAIFYALALQ